MVTGITANLGPFCNKDFFPGVSSFLGDVDYPLVLDDLGSRSGGHHGRNVSCLEDCLGGAILEMIFETLEVKRLSFLILVFWYCR